MSTAFTLGRDAYSYRNTGTYLSPTWTKITGIRDLTLNLDSEQADVATRETGRWSAKAVVELTASVDIEMIWRTANTHFAAFRTTYINTSTIEVLILDGPVTTPGSEGLRMESQVGKISRPEPLKDAMKGTVQLVPTLSDNAPAWYTAV